MYTGLGVKSFWEYHMQSLNKLDSGFQVLLKAQEDQLAEKVSNTVACGQLEAYIILKWVYDYMLGKSRQLELN